MDRTPRYPHASYADETLTLENAHLRLDVHKRMTGWGWGEIYTETGKLMGVFLPPSREEQVRRGEELLLYQREDGAFPFDPDGRHYMKDDFVVAREYLELMDLSQDTALDI